MSALSILEIAQKMLLGAPVAKAEPAPGSQDPDAVEGKDPRATGGEPTAEALEQARQEAQSGQQAAAEAAPNPDGSVPGTPGAGGAAEGGEDEEGGAGGSGAPEPDGDEAPQVAKAEILASMKFLAESSGITPEEVAKAFSGGEGNPNFGKAPVGQGVELLQSIAEGQQNQNKILEAIAAFLADLTKKTVSLSGELTKSLEASESAKSTAEAVRDSLAGIMKTAPAALPKAEAIVAKALGQGGEAPAMTSADLFKVALTGKLSPTEVAAANRSINYGR